MRTPSSSCRQTIKVEFDAAYPGCWIHCHLLYHQAAGMMTVLRYEIRQRPMTRASLNLKH